MQKIKHLFFDLDKTLWDFEKNSTEVLIELYKDFDSIHSKVNDLDDYLKVYNSINIELWEKLKKGAISKSYLRENRFHLTHLEFGIDNKKLAIEFDQLYLSRTPGKKKLIPFTIPVLELLKQRYEMHIITNGFDDVQYYKLNNCGLSPYFKAIITSDAAEACKPQKEIFDFALKKANAIPENSIMIGDDKEADIIGAYNAGLDVIYFNRNGENNSNKKHKEVHCLSELLEYL
jgi:putative hydrolase of the HAD superfamily